MIRWATVDRVVRVGVDQDNGQFVATQAHDRTGLPTARVRRGPSWRNSSSPAGCPKESLISLKWLRSTKRNAISRGVASVVGFVGEEEVEDQRELTTITKAR